MHLPANFGNVGEDGSLVSVPVHGRGLDDEPFFARSGAGVETRV